MDEIMSQPVDNFIDEPYQLDDLAVSDPADPERFIGIDSFNLINNTPTVFAWPAWH